MEDYRSTLSRHLKGRKVKTHWSRTKCPHRSHLSQDSIPSCSRFTVWTHKIHRSNLASVSWGLWKTWRRGVVVEGEWIHMLALPLWQEDSTCCSELHLFYLLVFQGSWQEQEKLLLLELTSEPALWTWNQSALKSTQLPFFQPPPTRKVKEWACYRIVWIKGKRNGVCTSHQTCLPSFKQS